MIIHLVFPTYLEPFPQFRELNLSLYMELFVIKIAWL